MKAIIKKLNETTCMSLHHPINMAFKLSRGRMFTVRFAFPEYQYQKYQFSC